MPGVRLSRKFGTPKLLICFSSFVLMFGDGCAAVTVEKVPSGDTSNLQGVRFYRSAPYLMVSDVSGDSKQTATAAGNKTSTQAVQFKLFGCRKSISSRQSHGSEVLRSIRRWKTAGISRG